MGVFLENGMKGVTQKKAAQLLHSPIFTEKSPFWRLIYLHEHLQGAEHIPLLWGSFKQGFFIFKTFPTNLSFSFLLIFFFFFGQWMVHTILSNNNQRRMKTAAWEGAQDMIPPHRMPGRCHWNSLSLSATRVEPIWTPSKVLKTPLFIITVKWWDIVYPDWKINSHLQNARLTVLNVIWFLFKCKMKLGSQ